MMPNQEELSSAIRFDRRILMRSGVALGAGVAGSGALIRISMAAQQDQATPDASSAAGNVTTEIVAAANAFLDTLSDTEKDSVLFDWDDTEQKQRWSNLPEGGFERNGLMWGDLGEEPRDAWLKLMQVTLSSEGYERVIAEWNADDALGGGGGGGGLVFGTQYYWVGIIGTPSETDPWQWQWGGHHVTVNATIVGENLALTPSFIGVQPATYTDESGNTVRPLGDIEDEAFALINALDDTQRQTAVLGDSYMDLVLGPGQDGRTIEPEGLPASEMTDDQQEAFLQLIGHYAGLVNESAAEARIAEIAADLDETYLAWYGPTEEGSAAYFRVTGPTIVIEYAPQGMGGDPANHIHGIYRDPTNDYSAKYTGITITS
jgi:hypothetical protein